MSNAFERFAETQMVAATKAKHRAAETRERNRQAKVVQSEKDAPMKLSPMEQAMADSSKQFRGYIKAKRAELKQLLQGPDGERWRELVNVLRALTLEDGDRLIDFVRRQRLRDADSRARQVAIGLIDDAIDRLRVQNGYAPMDDALPGEPPTVFQIIRDELKVTTA